MKTVINKVMIIDRFQSDVTELGKDEAIEGIEHWDWMIDTRYLNQLWALCHNDPEHCDLLSTVEHEGDFTKWTSRVAKAYILAITASV